MTNVPPNPPELPQNELPRADDLAELKELARSLILTAQALQAQSARGAVLRDVIEDVRMATRAIVTAPTLATPSVPPVTWPNAEPCGDAPCECTSPNCCCFDIVMTHVRVVDMQIEVVDSNITPFFNMEVQMFASIDGIGTVIPSMFGYLSLHKLLNKPGVWSQVQRTIGTVCVPKKNPKTILITVDAVEVEQGEPTAGRDEYGTASSSMTLECCCSTQQTISFEVDFTGGGQGGGTIEVKFAAVRKC